MNQYCSCRLHAIPIILTILLVNTYLVVGADRVNDSLLGGDTVHGAGPLAALAEFTIAINLRAHGSRAEDAHQLVVVCASDEGNHSQHSQHNIKFNFPYILHSGTWQPSFGRETEWVTLLRTSMVCER